ncbi:hypothetical protein EYZ11_007615 [Aspergillus tanneri]|nr:hypothetical protein EYZ11_007615 [Aspergillus tanneri]
MLFASTFDLGLIPFYVFAAFLGYKQYTENAYHWATLLSSDFDITTKISQTTFLLSVVNGGLHALSLGISVFLSIIFRRITKLPPDMNPLEDNLTARPHKRTKSELAEKHASHSTLDSTMSEDPLIGPPRKMAFMHTRAQSSEGGSSRVSDVIAEKRQSQMSQPSSCLSRIEPSLPHMPFEYHADSTDYMVEQIPDNNAGTLTKPTTTIPHGSPVREPSPELPSRSQCVSPASGNWIVYPSRSPSPLDVAINESSAHREPSSAYSRGSVSTTTNGGVMDWVNSAQRYGWDIGQTIKEDTHGEYESLPVHEYYGHDDDHDDLQRHSRYYDNAEQDIGDHNIQIFQDHDPEEQASDNLRVNPLALNPPTPQPILDNAHDDTTDSSRTALADIPNLSPTPPTSLPKTDNPTKKGRFYGDLEGKGGLSIPRHISHQDSGSGSHGIWGKKSTKGAKTKKQKSNAYGALKQHDDNDHIVPSSDLTVTEGDRKGRVVSNSGVDFGRGFGQGSSLSYGSYIAGLGVGRRRDVSGKMAEEGRSGRSNSGNEGPAPIRAAGWARFAGL